MLKQVLFGAIEIFNFIFHFYVLKVPKIIFLTKKQNQKFGFVLKILFCRRKTEDYFQGRDGFIPKFHDYFFCISLTLWSLFCMFFKLHFRPAAQQNYNMKHWKLDHWKPLDHVAVGLQNLILQRTTIFLSLFHMRALMVGVANQLRFFSEIRNLLFAPWIMPI